MTFDEAQTLLLEQDLDYEVALLVIYVMDTLKSQYAPTVEMTKEQYKIFNEDIQLNQEALNDYIDEVMGLPKITNKEMLNLYIHPETIKIIDEEK